MGFHLGLSDRKSPQVSRTLLSILANLNNAVVLVVSTSLLVSKTSRFLFLFTNPLGIAPSAPITISITVTYKFQFFFSFLGRYWLLSSFSISFNFFSIVCRADKVHYLAGILSFFGWVSQGLIKIKWSVCISKSLRSLCASFSNADSGLCIYHLLVWSNFNFLHDFLVITFPLQSCVVL